MGLNVAVNGRPNNRHPMAEALEWVGRIFAVSLVMFVPGLVGQYLDRKFGTGFLVLVGFIFGLTVGLWYLLTMTGGVSTSGHGPTDQDKSKENDRSEADNDK